MEQDLTPYLFRTFKKLRNGLKVRLKILQVNGSIETFSEQDNPTAIILPHGLFLACAKSSHLRDPLLVAVLNQIDLKDDEPKSKLGVVWNSRRAVSFSDPANEKFKNNQSADLAQPNHEMVVANTDGDHIHMEQQVSIVKHGLTKHIPPSARFHDIAMKYFQDHANELSHKDFRSRTVPGLPTSVLDLDPNLCLVEPVDIGDPYCSEDPTRIFLSVLQVWLDEHTQTIVDAGGYLKIKNIPDLPSTAETTAETKISLRHFDHVKSFGSMLKSTYNTLAYYRDSLPPQSQAELLLYQSKIRRTQEVLYALSAAILRVLLEPFAEAMIGFELDPTPLHHQLNLEIGRLVLQESTEWVKKLMKMSTMPHDQIKGAWEDPIKPPAHGLLGEKKLLHPTLDCIKKQKFAFPFFEKLKQQLCTYPVEYRSNQRAILMTTRPRYPFGSMHEFKMYFITHLFDKLDSRFLKYVPDYRLCLTKRANGIRPSVRFFTGPDTNCMWNLVAIFCKREVKVCFMSQLKPDAFEPGPRPPTVGGPWGAHKAIVQVFRHDNLTATYEFEPCDSFDNPKCALRALHYYTGRYFVLLQGLNDVETSIVLVVDFAPCFEDPPSSPVFFYKRLKSFYADKQHAPPLFTCNDRFLTFMSFREIPVDQSKPMYKPVVLQIIKFDSSEGLVPIQPISCEEQFEAITQQINMRWVYRILITGAQLCWLEDLKTLFYARWRLAGTQPDTNTLFLGCFRISGSPPLLETLAFTCFHVADIIPKDLLVDVQPRFKTLRTRIRDYLVMDLMPKMEYVVLDIKQPQATLARALFTLHKGKIHWVPVNRSLVFRIPWHIGTPINYPGYETGQMSLFHHRRIFSSQKVLTTIHRLRYIST